MTKFKTASEVWLYLSEIFAKPISECSEEEELLTRYGICDALWCWESSGNINYKLWGRLRDIVNCDVLKYIDGGAYFVDTSPSNRILRSDYCYLLYCQEVSDDSKI